MSINAIDTNEEKLRKQQEMAGLQGVNPFAPAQGTQPVEQVNPLENKDVFTAAREGMGQQPNAQPSGAPIDVMEIFGFERTTGVTKPEEAGKTPNINETLNAQKPQTLEVKNKDTVAELEGKKDPTIPTVGDVKDVNEVKPMDLAMNAPTSTASDVGAQENPNNKVAGEGATAKDVSVATPIADKTAPPPTAKNTQSTTGSENAPDGVNPANSSEVNPSNVNTESPTQDQTQKLLKFGRPANA